MSQYNELFISEEGGEKKMNKVGQALGMIVKGMARMEVFRKEITRIIWGDGSLLEKIFRQIDKKAKGYLDGGDFG